MPEAAARLPARPQLPRLALTERQQIRAAARGDDRAFATIYKRYAPDLYRYCAAVLRSPEDAADTLQSAMAKALGALRSGTEPQHLKAWLYRIAHNEAIGLIRSRHDHDDLCAADEVVDQRQRAAVQSRAELRELLEDLHQLPDRQRAALVMRELGGLSVAEIATALATSTGAAKQAIFEARAGLHDMAEGREMECVQVRRALSDGDGRGLKGRQLRAHLRSCGGCTTFKNAIAVRRAELHAMPVLPVLGGGAILNGILGGGGASAGGGGALAATSGAAGLTAAKVAAVTVLTAAVGFGGAEVSKVLGGNHDPTRGASAVDAVRGGSDGSPGAAGGQPSSRERRAEHSEARHPAAEAGRNRKGGDERTDGTGPPSGPPRVAAQSSAAPAARPPIAAAPTTRGDRPDGLPQAAQTGSGQTGSQANLPSQATNQPQAPQRGPSGTQAPEISIPPAADGVPLSPGAGSAAQDSVPTLPGGGP